MPMPRDQVRFPTPLEPRPRHPPIPQWPQQPEPFVGPLDASLPPGRRRVLIATAVGARLAAHAAGTGAATVRPDLAAHPELLAAALAEIRPHTLIVGANAVSGDALARWASAVRATGDGRALVLIRRGTSLAAIDLDTAARLAITVRNTPEVNARHVAQFMIDHLFTAHQPADDGGPSGYGMWGRDAPQAPGTVGLLGAGAINGWVARAAVARGWRLVVCSPSLVTDGDAFGAWLRHHRLPEGAARVAVTAAETLALADVAAIAIPLVHTGPWATVGLLDSACLTELRSARPIDARSARLVSVSEPEVFTTEALLAAHDCDDLTVVLDNAPRLLAPVRDLLAAHLGGEGQPRPGFTLCSAAMRTPACDADLDQAVLAVAGRADLDEIPGAALRTAPPPVQPSHQPAARTTSPLGPSPLGPSPLGPSPADRDDRESAQQVAGRIPHEVGRPEVVIVGGGIVGLTTALLLRLRGWRRILVVDAAQARRTDAERQGTTFGGGNARHLSATETLPQAVAHRADVLARAPSQGGWRLRAPDSLDAAETAWQDAFTRRVDEPGLHACAQELTIALNRLGLRGWADLFGDDAQHWLRGLRRDARLARVYLDEAELDAGERVQRAAGPGATRLDRAALARGWPGLGHTVPLPGGQREIAGAVEVDGYAINIHDLADALAGRLRELGVDIWADARVDHLRATLPAPDVHGAARTDVRTDRLVDGMADGVRVRFAGGGMVEAGRVVVTAGGRGLDRLLGEGGWPGAGAVTQLLGLSLTLANPGLTRPLKIHAGDPLGVLNVTLSPDGSLIHVSGGFGFLGGAGRVVARDGIEELRTVLVQAVGGLFPGLRDAEGSLAVRDVRICERPATPDGLPLITGLPAFGGRVVVAAGTNAGGTVQAPAVAMLAADLLGEAPRCAGLALTGDRIGLPRKAEERPSASD